MTEKNANKKPTEPDPKDVSAGAGAPRQNQATGPQNVFASEAPSNLPSQVEPGTDPNDNVAAGGTPPGQHQATAPQNVFASEASKPEPVQVEPGIDRADSLAAGGIPPTQAPGQPGQPATGATESKPTTCDLPVSSLDVAAGGQAPGQHQATGPQNVFATEAPSNLPSQVEPGTDPNDNVAAGAIAPTKTQVSTGRTPQIISTPLDPSALGPDVSAVDVTGASQGDDVSAGAAAPGPYFDPGPGHTTDPNIKVRVKDADLTSSDQNNVDA